MFDEKNLKSLGVQNEVRVWTSIYRLVSEYLSRFPTTLEEDLKILRDDDGCNKLNSNERNCIVFRIGEKNILSNLLDISSRFKKVLEMEAE